jgi:signal transduction histidine kinase
MVGAGERSRGESAVNSFARLQPGAGSLAEVAHDARNLVTALVLYCDMLGEPGVLSPGSEHYADELRLVATACRRLVEQLVVLDARRMISRKQAPSEIESPVAVGRVERIRSWEMLPPVPVKDLAAELASSRNLLSALAGPGIQVSIETEGGARPVRLSGEDLTRILVNLVKNASEAMPAGGRIHIGLREKTLPGAVTHLLLSVEDSGPGISSQTLEKIFESGYSTRQTGAGVMHRGLGLSITRSIVAAAGGRISATNRPPSGACFEIELPSGLC